MKHKLALSQSQSRAYILVLIKEQKSCRCGCLVGVAQVKEKWDDTGGKPAAVTGLDRQTLEARLVRRRGASEAVRSVETPLADKTTYICRMSGCSQMSIRKRTQAGSEDGGYF